MRFRGQRPVVAVTSGEPAGIGPELCLALAGRFREARPVILADRRLLRDRASQLGLPVEVRDYVPGVAHSDAPRVLDVLHVPLATPSRPGRLDPANSGYVLALLDRAIEGCQTHEFAAMVTGPIHKGVINDATLPGQGHFSGHTEYLATRTGASDVVMMLTGVTASAHPDRRLRVALATTHLPLREVAAAITPKRLAGALHVLHRDLRRKYGFDAPRILVAGLNPHAGESGHMGREEIEVITPTLEKLRREGLALIGPLPADTLFTPPVLKTGDAVLAMYHDQGLAPLKYATFGKGINVTLGLPIIRTSVDHGTALDLAGTGKADPGSLLAAVREATRMARQHDTKKTMER
ncbi:MAG: 4-hydroxythreonine-4-phosphate dehydrogenase PdxA [Zoogloeaceae bacterium]|jgi:4-hydroxythreonine-4-phosphate dehydrogenase|nr:4-hydroxythreonine-4-phosphate dehydrogenase PdxA [Zoogloeaceae bacterium]